MTTLDRSNVHLLLVEDNPRYLNELIEWLEEEFGYQHIETASDVAQARAKLDEKPFDIIVADMRLDGDAAGGFAVLDEVKLRRITSVVIILTANDPVEDCRRAFKEGAWDYLSKSMKGNVFEELDQSILEAINTFNRRGNDKDEEWIEQNMASLLASHGGQYIAVINNKVIEVAETEEELRQRLQERKLPVFVPTIKKIELSLEKLSAKLTIFVEGPTDVDYIKKAATILGKEALLQEVYLDTIGDQTGQSGSGWKPMVQGFNFLKTNPSFRPNKVLFLFDQDVKDKELPNKGEDFENLLVRRINGGDYSSEKKGIEWLFADLIFEEGFNKKLVQKDLGRATVDNPNPEPTYIIEDGNKKKFCDWICSERKNTPEDFEGFKKIFDMIEAIILE